MALDETLRTRILDDLSAAYSRDSLTIDEYEQRVKAVTGASDNIQLVNINADIFPPAKYSTTTSSAAPLGATGAEHHEMVAIFSSSNLQGEFIAPKRITVTSIFGGADIDLRFAQIPPEGVQIETTAIFGGINIRLPENISADVNGSGIFGGFQHPPYKLIPGAPKVRIRGVAIFGGVDVKIVNSR